MNNGISLHIGINELSWKYAIRYRELMCAENDARAMLLLAQDNGFRSTLLPPQQAMYKNVTQAVMDAADCLRAGDAFLLTFSGHGSWFDDPCGIEPSGTDSVWCLYDTPITDNEVGQLLSRFAAGVNIVIITDSCSSGSISNKRTMGGQDTACAGVVKAITPDVAKAAWEKYRQENPPLLKGCDHTEIKANVLVISASQDFGRNGGSAAYDGFSRTEHSRFTDVLLRVWRDGAFPGDYLGLFEAVKRVVSAVDFLPCRMNPNYHTEPIGNPSHWAGMVPFSIGKRYAIPGGNVTSNLTTFVPVPSPEANEKNVVVSDTPIETVKAQGLMPADDPAKHTLTLTMEVVVPKGKVERARGATVLILDAQRNIRDVWFVGSEGVGTFVLASGDYTILCMMNYTFSGEVVQRFLPKALRMPNADHELTLKLGGPGDKGDIRAIVKVDGPGSKTIPDRVTVQPGNFVKETGEGGVAYFTGLAAGEYTVTAEVQRICSDGQPRMFTQTKDKVKVPEDDEVPVPFNFTVCSP